MTSCTCIKLLKDLTKVNYQFFQNQFLEGLLPEYRPATEAELKISCGDWKYGAYFTTLVIESRYHLPWLQNK